MPPVLQALPRSAKGLILVALQTLQNHLGYVANTVSSRLNARVSVPSDLARLMADAADLHRVVTETRADLPLEFTPEQLSVLRTALAMHRRTLPKALKRLKRDSPLLSKSRLLRPRLRHWIQF